MILEYFFFFPFCWWNISNMSIFIFPSSFVWYWDSCTLVTGQRVRLQNLCIKRWTDKGDYIQKKICKKHGNQTANPYKAHAFMRPCVEPAHAHIYMQFICRNICARCAMRVHHDTGWISHFIHIFHMSFPFHSIVFLSVTSELCRRKKICMYLGFASADLVSSFFLFASFNGI